MRGGVFEAQGFTGGSCVGFGAWGFKSFKRLGLSGFRFFQGGGGGFRKGSRVKGCRVRRFGI